MREFVCVYVRLRVMKRGLVLHLSQAIRLEAQGSTTATPCLNKSSTDCKDLVDQVVNFFVDMNLGNSLNPFIAHFSVLQSSQVCLTSCYMP